MQYTVNNFELSIRMTLKNLMVLFCLCLSLILNAQESLSEVLEEYNNGSIPYITVDELATSKTETVLLDARETKEFRTSHLENAINVGYDEFNIQTVLKNIKDKTTRVVVYCSIGVRSEDIAEKLKEEGYTNVYNLYGGIFEWKNNDYIVYDHDNAPTENVHTYSKKWSKWLLKGNKIYD